jgi:hypothetical protein
LFWSYPAVELGIGDLNWKCLDEPMVFVKSIGVKWFVKQQAFGPTSGHDHDSATLCLFGDVHCHYGRLRHYFYERVLLQLLHAWLSVS